MTLIYVLFSGSFIYFSVSVCVCEYERMCVCVNVCTYARYVIHILYILLYIRQSLIYVEPHA